VRVVAQHLPDRADRLAEGAVRHGDVAPDAVEYVAAVDRLSPPLDQEHQHVEIPRNERHLAPVADEDAPARHQQELAETIAGHGWDHTTM
jgi:hypothetical protein